MPDTTEIPNGQPPITDKGGTKGVAPTLILGFVLGLIEMGLPMIGITVNIYLGAVVLTAAFALLAHGFWQWEKASKWSGTVRVSTLVVLGLIYFALVGYQIHSQYRKDHPQARHSNPAAPTSGYPPVIPAPTGTTTPREQTRKQRPSSPPASIPAQPNQAPTSGAQTGVVIGGDVHQESTGPCSPNIIGSGNTTNCAPTPRVIASKQMQRPTGNPERPWETVFTITSNVLVQTGDLRLKCSGPALIAGISRINPASLATGSNGPNPSDPDEVIYQLGPEMLSPGKVVTISVYSMQPVTVISGSIGPNGITF